MTEHSRYSPSAAHRWLRCPGSIALEAQCPQTSSAYADEGTKAHELAAMILNNETITPADYDEDMLSHVTTYTRAVREAATDATLYVEKRVDFGLMLGLSEGEGFGTVDAPIVGDGFIEVHDLKYGVGVKVEAEENEQLMLYALGLLNEFEMLGPFNRVKLVIHQPRLDHVSEWEIAVRDLQAWADEVGATIEALADAVEPDLHPGEKQCRFCKARGICPALAQKVQDAIAIEFPDLTEEVIAEDAAIMGPNRLAEALGAVDLIETWTKAVRERAYTVLAEGGEIPGYKLVAGKKGSRQWSDEAAAREALKSMRLKVEEMFDLRLISPTSAEKLAKAGTLGAKQWKRLQTLITQAEGKPHVAPSTDKRPPLPSVAEQFPVLA